MDKITILIIDDESTITDALKFALERENFNAIIAHNAAEGLRKFKDINPNLVVLDIGLPDISGFELCKKIREISVVPIIFLTARSEEIDKVLGLEIGGDDYVVKPFAMRELAARIKSTLRRSEQTQIQQQGTHPDFVVDHERCLIFYHNKTLDLSRYEYRILATLINRPGKVFSREALMNRVWDTPEMSLERTIDTHIKTIRSKLKQIKDNDDPIVTHRGFGYSLKES